MTLKEHKKKDIKNLLLPELEAFVTSLGEQRYRARQLMGWLYYHKVSSFEEMTNLPKAFRTTLTDHFYLSTLIPRQLSTSRDGTLKFLFELEDGNCIESVLISEKKHYTICISTQVGCALGCTFCLSGKGGLVRNLEPSEITNQVCTIQRAFLPEGATCNIVCMGMGEPLHNYDHTLHALTLLTTPAGFNFSHRRITVSTAGLIPQLQKLCQSLPINLAISLNASSNEVRNILMPINRKYPLEALLDTVSHLPLQPRKRITFEYILIQNVNDSPADATELVRVLKHIPCKINLIPFNEHEGAGFKRPDDYTIRQFRDVLISHHFTTIVRESKGRDISAACGQLRCLRTSMHQCG